MEQSDIRGNYKSQSNWFNRKIGVKVCLEKILRDKLESIKKEKVNMKQKLEYLDKKYKK